jgi:Tc toxin complex TcA C-terminal TcB-binding domain/FG-GAP-like repeat
LVDLRGNGLPDVVELGAAHHYWSNRGEGRFELPRPILEAPPHALGDPGVRFLDANGDGRPDLLVTAGAQAGLAKIHCGLNIAGVSDTGYETALPSQYRYSVLVERARNLVAIAQQVEAAYLSALEQRDAKTYDALRAGHDLDVAAASVTIQVTKLAEAVTGMRLAGLQRERAQLQENHYDRQLMNGLNGWEETGLDAMKGALALQTLAGVAFGANAAHQVVKAWFTIGLLGDPMKAVGETLSALAGAASTGGQIAQTLASYERRAQEWQLQHDLAAKDVAIGDQQVQLALLPAGRGVRATLSASGVSRTVVARGPFEVVTLRRQPESIAFTSPTNASGLFDLEPEGGLLLPFEGMGVDTVWQLELPRPPTRSTTGPSPMSC